MAIVVPPDIEAFLCAYIRKALGVEVDCKQPRDWDGSTPLVVVRDDGGPMTGPCTYERTVGVSVYAGSRADVTAAGALARRVLGTLSSMDVVLADGSPIAAVLHDGFNGPYRVTDAHDASAWYMTASYIAVGDAIED